MSEATAVIPTDSTHGDFPDGWELRPLDAISDVRLGRQRSPKNHSGDQMRPYLRAANVTWTGLSLNDVAEMNFTDEEMATYLVEPGDILVNEASGSPAEVGKAAVFRGEIDGCAFQNTLIRIRPHSICGGYLHQFLLRTAITGGYLEDSRGVGIFHLGKTKLAAWPIPVPPVAEQERIVEILEEQLSRLDAALESVRVVRKKAAQFRRSLLHAAFTGILTGQDRNDWGIQPLGELASISYGYTESASDLPIGPKFLRITDLRTGGVSWGDVPFCAITETALEKQRLSDRDIVFARTGATTGKSFLVKDPPEAVAASYLIRLRPNVDLVEPEYLDFFFQSDEYWAQIYGGIAGTAQGGFNATKLSALLAPIPPLAEQERIVEILEEQLSRLDAALAVADGVEKRSAALRRSLLHAAFTGRLTEQWREQTNV